MRRYLLQTAVLFFVATLWLGCDKNDDDDNNQKEDTFKLSGAASGAQERPNPVTTNATGTITGTYRKEDKMLDYTIIWSNLSTNPVAMHFHGPAVADSAAGVQVPITGFAAATSGSVSGMATLSAEQESQLLGGLWYYNIHSDTYKGGEIRGNITATAD